MYAGLNRLTNVVDAIGTTRFSHTEVAQSLSEDGSRAEDSISDAYGVHWRA